MGFSRRAGSLRLVGPLVPVAAIGALIAAPGGWAGETIGLAPDPSPSASAPALVPDPLPGPVTVHPVTVQRPVTVRPVTVRSPAVPARHPAAVTPIRAASSRSTEPTRSVHAVHAVGAAAPTAKPVRQSVVRRPKPARAKPAPTHARPVAATTAPAPRRRAPARVPFGLQAAIAPVPRTRPDGGALALAGLALATLATAAGSLTGLARRAHHAGVAA